MVMPCSGLDFGRKKTVAIALLSPSYATFVTSMSTVERFKPEPLFRWSMTPCRMAALLCGALLHEVNKATKMKRIGASFTTKL